jgi:gamma-glutamyltranspeptidase/glutathione hydrolase
MLASMTILAVAQTPQTPQKPDTFRPTIRGKRAIVAGGHPLSVEAGMRMLHRGGNAVDAGVATVLAASVIEFSHFAFGGEIPVLIKLAGKAVEVVNGQGQAPKLATREFFESRGKTEASRGFQQPAIGRDRPRSARRDDCGARSVRHDEF